jgi:hypothetical protein
MDPKDVQVAYAALMDATAWARARGMSEDEIRAEYEDMNSQFWKDVGESLRRLRQAEQDAKGGA